MSDTIATDEEVLVSAYQRTFKPGHGQKVVEDLRFYVNRQSHSGDALETAFKEGERAMALHILRMSGEIE